MPSICFDNRDNFKYTPLMSGERIVLSTLRQKDLATAQMNMDFAVENLKEGT